MDIEDMNDLLQVYDAKWELEDVVASLMGAGPYAFGFEDGIIGKISRVAQVIIRNSPVYDPDDDFHSQPIGRALDDRSLSYEERARVILGMK